MTALPVLSCAGIRCTLLPTALFSSHTGGFPNPWRRDLTGAMEEILARWSALPLRFDGILIGYLASDAQFSLVDAVLDRFRDDNTKLFVDPVMGDNGRRYSYCTEAFTEGFLRLCQRADAIFPNATEAALLLGHPPETADSALAAAGPQLQELRTLGAGAAVLTGVMDNGRIGAGIMDAQQEQPVYAMHRRLPGGYPGTGDLYAACAAAGILRGMYVASACHLAGAFMERVLTLAGQTGTEPRFGVPFEMELPWLAKQFDEGYVPQWET